MTSVEQVAMDLNIDSERIENVLSLIQGFEPLGVGARSLKECLLIQIREDENRHPEAEKVVEYYLEDVAYNRLSKIAKELNMDIEEVQNICDYIKTLEPKPGRSFNDGIR